MSEITLTSLVAIIAPCTGKFIKNYHNVFERGENLLQNSILLYYSVFIGLANCQKLRLKARRKTDFSWHFKGLKGKNSNEIYCFLYIYLQLLFYVLLNHA